MFFLFFFLARVPVCVLCRGRAVVVVVVPGGSVGDDGGDNGGGGGGCIGGVGDCDGCSGCFLLAFYHCGCLSCKYIFADSAFTFSLCKTTYTRDNTT